MVLIRIFTRGRYAGATGSLRLLDDQAPFTFAYSTGDAADNNWVGLYDAAGGGPENEEFVGPSLKWAYAPGAEGTVTVSADGLDVGRYRAFFLSRDGYEWLAEPVDVAVERDPDAGLEFLVANVTTHNARQGDAFAYSVAGLVRDGDADVVFAKRSCGPAWLDVGADGTISGTPGDNATGDAQVLIRATRDGVSATIKLTIPVRPAGEPMVDRLRVLSFNMWMGGANVEDHHAKQVRFLATADVDVVGLQEDNGGGRDSRRLAAALGWHVWASGGSVAVLSRYPIAEEYGEINRSGGVRVALDGTAQEVNVFVVHLGYTPYGPYDFCFDKMPVERVLEREAESGRTGQITDTLKGMGSQLAATDSVPLLLLGDFNAPSHLDWVEELKERHCGYWDVPWPTSVKPEAEGLIDSFRVANPDPVAVRGVTWSPIFLTNNGRPEPLDRIDFIYHKGDQLKVVSSEEVVVGKPKPQPNHKQNEWTSDHAAVLTEFDLA